MKRLVFGLLLCVVFCGCVRVNTCGVAKKNFHLILLVGQSNMAGRGQVLPEDREPIPGVMMLNEENQWVPACHPIHFDKKEAGFGLAGEFAKDYLSEHPGVTVGLVPCAVGGSGIKYWFPGVEYAGAGLKNGPVHPFDDAVARVKIARQDGVFKAILWHQGEANCSLKGVENYPEMQKQVLTSLREACGVPDCPAVIGEVGRFFPRSGKRAGVALFLKAQMDALKICPRTGYASSEELTSNPDKTHFDRESLILFGDRYYQAFRTLEITK